MKYFQRLWKAILWHHRKRWSQYSLIRKKLSRTLMPHSPCQFCAAPTCGVVLSPLTFVHPSSELTNTRGTGLARCSWATVHACIVFDGDLELCKWCYCINVIFDYSAVYLGEYCIKLSQLSLAGTVFLGYSDVI